MMNISKVTTLLLLLIFPFFVAAHSDNFYIEIKKDQLEIGAYEGRNFKKKIFKAYPFKMENISEIQELLFKKGQEDVLYYFHCLYGGIQSFHKNSLKQLNDYNQSTKIVSIVWHAEHLKYTKNWQQSIEQSKLIENLLFELWSTPQKNNNILCHSMGHRIFEGIMKSVDNQVFKFENVLFMAGDLDVEVLDENLKILPNISNRIVVYVHEKDRLLKASAKRHKRQRLGLHGIQEPSYLSEIKNLERIDVTHSKGQKWFSATNHIYFKRDYKVLEDMAFLLEKDLIERKSFLKPMTNNRWKLGTSASIDK